ncbi:15258_t:CDS:2 [Gigaspora margarita]|uniref:15258_t:CDS:1 n=1 Tax=Gigaspora margarita TaxID=4874 RepID=A0ABN7UEE5_GIGMA|nr:15258_t:CDS:2 [Gigaspora margarita]
MKIPIENDNVKQDSEEKKMKHINKTNKLKIRKAKTKAYEPYQEFIYMNPKEDKVKNHEIDSNKIKQVNDKKFSINTKRKNNSGFCYNKKMKISIVKKQE